VGAQGSEGTRDFGLGIGWILGIYIRLGGWPLKWVYLSLQATIINYYS